MNPRQLARCLLPATALTLVLTTTACGDSDGGSDTSAGETTASAASPTASDRDEAAVRALLDDVEETWAAGDAEGYAALHTRDADLVDFMGTHLRGREAIEEFFAEAFAGPLKNTTVEARITDFRFLDDDVALFHTRGMIVPTGGESMQTFVATRGDDGAGWQLAAFQNTRIQEQPSS
ncbi:SgcJ/EcaC family oxidoreductase [Streptomyces sp. B6B3]|uniref:SgcJ/EcaC family oxidoreductase n=1 Tax=Streptomyces sp. B6B3 TaxID=3153570 RepID=UPI00325F74A6